MASFLSSPHLGPLCLNERLFVVVVVAVVAAASAAAVVLERDARDDHPPSSWSSSRESYSSFPLRVLKPRVQFSSSLPP